MLLLTVFISLAGAGTVMAQGTYEIPELKKLLKTLPQGLSIIDNPFDKVPEIVKRTKQFQRERWFYEQRMYPFNFIPENAYSNSLSQKNLMNSDNLPAPWVPIGPTPQFYLNMYNTTGRVSSVKYHPVNPSILYIGGANGGVWKSTNGGANWQAMTISEASLATGSIVIDPVNPNIIYCGTGEATYSAASYSGRGILKSTDGGLTWVNYTMGLPSNTYFSRLVIRPNNSNQLFGACGLNGGLVKSTNAGVSWSQVYSERCDDIVFSPSGDTAYLIGSGTGFRISTDGGATWGDDNILPVGNTRNQLAICRNFPNTVYITTYAGGFNIKMYKTTTGGASFSPVTLPDPMTYNAVFSWYCYYMYVNPFDPNCAYVGLIYPWRTTNGGQNWSRIDTEELHVDQQALDFHPTNPDEMLVGNDGGVWKSTNRGTNWINLNSNLNLTQFYRIAVDPVSPPVVLGGSQDNGTMIRPSDVPVWNGVVGGDGNAVAFHPLNHLHVMGYSAGQSPYFATDGGTTYSSWNSQSVGLTGSSTFMGVITANPVLSGSFYTTRQKVFLSTSAGSNWIQLNSSGLSGDINNLAVSRNGSTMFASTGAGIYKSIDSGQTFTDIRNGLPDRAITSIRVHPNIDSSNVVVITYSGFGTDRIYKTTNSGNNWISVSGNLPDTPVNDLLIYYPGQSSSTLIAATDIGVFISDNYGANWSVFGTGLPNTICMSLAHDEKATGRVRIGTMGRGTWETDVATSISAVNDEIPSNYLLEQNYPNPFNPVTIIKFGIPENARVKLVIYDILGREIKTLVNKSMERGIYESVFNSSGVTSGVYIYKLTTEKYSISKKMVILK